MPKIYNQSFNLLGSRSNLKWKTERVQDEGFVNNDKDLQPKF
jgi:hypothetical protein